MVKTWFDAKNDFVVDEEFEKRIGGNVGRQDVAGLEGTPFLFGDRAFCDARDDCFDFLTRGVFFTRVEIRERNRGRVRFSRLRLGERRAGRGDRKRKEAFSKFERTALPAEFLFVEIVGGLLKIASVESRFPFWLCGSLRDFGSEPSRI